jgi:hypothetical protein
MKTPGIKRLIGSLVLIAAFDPAAGFSQNLLIPKGHTPTIDGIYHSSEWSDANSIYIPINATDSTEVQFKHDSNQLYFAFVGYLQSGNYNCPELLFDADNDGGNSFQPDDWWFHVSATDCEYQGQYGNYNNCQLVRNNWLAAPNFSASGSVDTVEISIPFQTIGLMVSDTIGIGFVLNNFVTFKQYPSTVDHQNPSTWQSAVVSPMLITGLAVNASEQKQLKVYPNPSFGKLQLELGEELSMEAEISLRDITGKEVWRKPAHWTGDGAKELDLSFCEPGIYFLSLRDKDKMLSRKVVIQ